MDKKITIIDKYRIKYDEPSDVLYISIGRPKKAFSEMDSEDFIIRYAQSNHHLCGITIFNLNEYWAKHRRKFENNIKKYLKDISAKDILQTINV